MDDNVNLGTRTAGQNVAVAQVNRVHYLAATRGGKTLNSGGLPSAIEAEFKRAPDQGICELCGEQVVTTAAFHFDAQGNICIRDPKRTLLAGKISRARYEEIVAERSVQSEKTAQ